MRRSLWTSPKLFGKRVRMTPEDILLTTALALLGIVATLLSSWFYYRKAVRKGEHDGAILERLINSEIRSGIAGQYTMFEKVEIQAASCEKVDNGTSGSPKWFWKIILNLKNSGSATSTLNGVYVDDILAELVPIPTSPPDPPTIKFDGKKIYADVDLTTTKSIPSGQTKTVNVWVGTSWPAGNALTSGTTIDIKIHSTGGMDYIKLVRLV